MPWIETTPGATPGEIFPDWFLAHWERLAQEGDYADPFCCAPIWNLSYLDAIGTGKRIFYEASQGGALIFSEFFTTSGERRLVPIEDGWLYGTPLLGAESPFLLSDAMDELQEGHRSIIFLSGMVPRNGLAHPLLRLFSPEFKLFKLHEAFQRTASIRDGLEGWLSRRSANTRANLRKAIHRAERRGLCFERQCPDSENVSRAYERILAVEARSWKGREHCGMLESPSTEFYRTMISMLAQKRKALIIFASLEGKDVGFIFGAVQGNLYRGQQFSYDEELGKFSLGNLLQYETIKWLGELGYMRYDMGAATTPGMEYKYRWTEEQRGFQLWGMIPPNT